MNKNQMAGVWLAAALCPGVSSAAAVPAPTPTPAPAPTQAAPQPCTPKPLICKPGESVKIVATFNAAYGNYVGTKPGVACVAPGQTQVTNVDASICGMTWKLDPAGANAIRTTGQLAPAAK